jgi:hypothetical protein
MTAVLYVNYPDPKFLLIVVVIPTQTRSVLVITRSELWC